MPLPARDPALDLPTEWRQALTGQATPTKPSTAAVAMIFRPIQDPLPGSGARRTKDNRLKSLRIPGIPECAVRWGGNLADPRFVVG